MKSSAKISFILSMGCILEASLLYVGIQLNTFHFNNELYVIALLVIIGIVFAVLGSTKFSDRVNAKDMILNILKEVNNNIQILNTNTDMYPMLSTEAYIFNKSNGMPSNRIIDDAYAMVYDWNHKSEFSKTQNAVTLKMLKPTEMKERKILLDKLNKCSNFLSRLRL
ncbi:MAG: hypothetical protein ACP5RS_00270 [Thermoplasmata archaeon]